MNLRMTIVDYLRITCYFSHPSADYCNREVLHAAIRLFGCNLAADHSLIDRHLPVGKQSAIRINKQAPLSI